MLRFEQRKNEPLEMIAMRAFATSLKDIPRHHALAAATWMLALASDPKSITLDEKVINLTSKEG